MSDYETFSLVILLIGLVISAITLGITIGKKDKSLYQHSGPEKRWLKSKMSKNRIETYLCDGKARK